LALLRTKGGWRRGEERRGGGEPGRLTRNDDVGLFPLRQAITPFWVEYLPQRPHLKLLRKGDGLNNGAKMVASSLVGLLTIAFMIVN